MDVIVMERPRAVRSFLCVGVVCVALTLLSCGRSDDKANARTPKTPATVALAEGWAEDRVLNAISSRGTAWQDEWTSAYWAADASLERLITIKGIRVSFEPMADTPTDAARSGEWKARISFSGMQHRYADLAADPLAAEWIAGAGPIGSAVVYLRRKRSGRVLWATGKAGSPPVADNLYSPDERDVLATALQNFQHPDTPPERRIISRTIASVLQHDARTLSEVGAGVDKPGSVNALYIRQIEAVDLSQCPENFAEAYRGHVEAWRKGEKSVIESTWAQVAEIANAYGVGTYY